MITLNLSQSFTDIVFSPEKITELVEGICAQFDLFEATICISIIDDAQTIECNQSFLNHEGSTDCFSFDLSDGEDEGRVFDLIVNGERAVNEAEQRGHPPEAELALYITHGMLHMLGYDDLEESQARAMHQKEDEILQCFGYGIVYNSSRSSG